MVESKTYLSCESIGHRESGSDPAESVDDMGRQSADDALDRTADKLRGGYDHGTCQQ